MGQRFWLDSGGVHNVLGQTKGQSLNPTRRGVEWNQNGGMEPTGVATNHHQSGGGGCGIWCAGEQTTLQPSLEGCGAHNKNGKNQGTMELWRRAGVLITQEFSHPKSQHTIPKYSLKYWKNTKHTLLTFCYKPRNWLWWLLFDHYLLNRLN